MKENVFQTKFGDLKGTKWEVENPSCLVLIVTGMAEHTKRYNDFAIYLNKQSNTSVYSLDHFGQGDNGKLGLPIPNYFNEELLIFKDYIQYLKDTYKKKIFVFAHSMGSFLTQGYIEKYSTTIDKVILCGTNGRNSLVKFGALLSNIIVNKKNETKEAKLLYNLSIGAYDKKFKEVKLPNAWLSYNKENILKYNEDPKCGFRCSNRFYKCFLNGLKSIQKTKNIKKISKDLPILIVGGQDDPVGNFGKGLKNLYKLYTKNGLNVTLKIYPNMIHEILNELNKEIVYYDIAKFLKVNNV